MGCELTDDAQCINIMVTWRMNVCTKFICGGSNKKMKQYVHKLSTATLLLEI